MKNIIFTLIILSFATIMNSQEKYKENTDKSQSEIFLQSKNWEEGTYLSFNSNEDIKAAYKELNNLLESRENMINETDECSDNPALDEWESNNNGFVSMRKTYEMYECDLLNAGFEPKQVKEMPVFDDALATLVSIDGIVQVGNTIEFFSDEIYAKAPIDLKERLHDILTGNEMFEVEDKDRGIEITFRDKVSCKASFTLEINHNSKEVQVVYTGDPISGGDKQITWSVEGNNHKNETSFTHKYSTVGPKKICVTYTEYAVLPDTIYYYTSTTKDSTYTIGEPVNKDTTVQVTTYTSHFKVNFIKKLVCSDTYCKEFELGSCTADFDYVIGIDNVVTFTNKSSTPYGTITGYLWQFGDGNTSSEANPTHIYECNKDFIVTLIIYSNQCVNGQESTEQKIKPKGLLCCDKNPQSSWKEKKHPTDSKKKIKYRYDMGTNWEWLDQDFKGKIKYYEYRKGGLFGKVKWRKTKGELDVNFNGNVFAKDEDGCICQIPRMLEAQPSSYNGKSKVFKDALGGNNLGSEKTVWMKDSEPVLIDYLVDGVLYLTQTCTNEPGFVCEQSE
jgi:hypothetical protein